MNRFSVGSVRSLARAARILVVLAPLASCDTHTPITLPDAAPIGTPAIDIGGPFAFTLFQGMGSGYGMRLTRSGGFTGPVTMSMEGVPGGIVATEWFPAVVVPSGQTNWGFTIFVSDTMPARAYPMRLRATGVGVADTTAWFILTVAEAPFLLHPPKGPLTVPQGGGIDVDIPITRPAGSSEPVTVSPRTIIPGVVIVPASITTTAGRPVVAK